MGGKGLLEELLGLLLGLLEEWYRVLGLGDGVITCYYIIYIFMKYYIIIDIWFILYYDSINVICIPYIYIYTNKY